MKKRTLFSSIVSLILCFALTCGATFALFTSESKVNIAVTSGTVDVVANTEIVATYSATGKDVMSYGEKEKNVGNSFANGGYANFNAQTKTFELNKMTPGDRVDIKILVENYSNVNIRYRTVFADATTDEMKKGGVSLFDALIFSVNDMKVITSNTTAWSEEIVPTVQGGVLEEINVIVAFPDGGFTGNDNKYKGLECALNITLEAVQANADIFSHVKPAGAPNTSAGNVSNQEQEDFQNSIKNLEFYGGLYCTTKQTTNGADYVAVYDVNESVKDIFDSFDFASRDYKDELLETKGNGEIKTINLGSGYNDSWNNINLGTKYKFEMERDANGDIVDKGIYGSYLCEFAVYCDKDVRAGTAGVYGEAFGQEIGFILPQKLNAGQEIHVMELLLTMVVNAQIPGLAFPYKMLELLNGEFYCAPLDVANQNKGTTMTVELRMYEPACNYIELGYATLDDALSDALNNGNENAIGCFVAKSPDSYFILNKVEYTFN